MSRTLTTTFIRQLDTEIELEERVNRLWKKFDQLDDEYYRQQGNRNLPQTVTIMDVSRAEMIALAAQQDYYRHIYETGDCECTPISDACQVCRAYANMKAEYRVKEL